MVTHTALELDILNSCYDEPEPLMMVVHNVGAWLADDRAGREVSREALQVAATFCERGLIRIGGAQFSAPATMSDLSEVFYLPYVDMEVVGQSDSTLTLVPW